MKAIAWAIIFASLIIFEGLTWNDPNLLVSFFVAILEITALIQVARS